MKIYCQQCKKDISKDVDYRFEKIVIGKIRCENCGCIQTRFVGQTDLFLYNGIVEIFYILLTLMAMYIYDNLDSNWWLGIIAGVCLCGFIPIQKQISRRVYSKKFKKVAYAEQKDIDLNVKLRKEVNTSFMIFVLFAIVGIMNANYRIEFIFGQIIITVLSFVKFYKNIKEN